MATLDPFNARQTLSVGGDYYALDALDANGVSTAHLPYSIRILLEGALRGNDGFLITEEDIRRSGHTLRLLTGRWQSLLVLICKDFIDEALARFAADLRASLVLVPACSETTGVFASGASNLAQRRQAHGVVVNQRPGRGEGVSAIRARPRREAAATLHTAASPAPGLRWITLCDGPWDPDT